MRTIDASTVSAVNADGAYAIDFVSVIADSTDATKQIHVSNGFKDIVFNGTTFTAAQSLLSISSIDETLDVKTNSIEVALSGLDPAIIAAVAGNPTVGSIVTIYRGYWNITTGAMVATPYNRWQGVVNSYNFQEDNSPQGTVTVGISCKNIVAALLETESGRFTSRSSFQQHDSTDLSMEFVESLVDWNPRFGADND